MTRLSIATLITTLVLLTGCDAADMAYNIFTTEEYELLCQAESGEGIKKVTKNGRTEVTQNKRSPDDPPESDPYRIILVRDSSLTARLIESDGDISEGTFYPTMTGVRLTFDPVANGEVDAFPQTTKVEALNVYNINFDLSFSYEGTFFATDGTETAQAKVTGEGNCKHLDWGTP